MTTNKCLVEKLNGKLLSKVRVVQETANLSGCLLGEVMAYVVYADNRSITKAAEKFDEKLLAKLQHKFYKESAGMKSQREGTKRGAVREPHAQKKEATVKRGKERDSEAQHKATAQGPRNGCLSCKGLHWVKDCPNLTETQRKEVLDRLQEKKNKASEDRDTHTLHRPDWTNIPAPIVEELQALQPSLQIEQMAEPIVANLADGTPVDCATKLRGDLQLVTSAGTVNVSGVECLVLPTGRDEVLLGD
ncbi:hypothetical protein Pcac1_g13200 [Phytophthora cactorum]|nr:hypothetical protein Pcac1_g13192 [Phytophthora cactorum]KAG2776408.1 hypothetical protein Pcac1_g13200 [Phytophthora cactorum]